ncbi:ABC transporter substrate-binding protein [Gordonia neofelifaecis]|uniref:Spermidine/putrescine ABC transporter substrate-binding protein n=1 Tax=Gordonia neofelifaecis NRRL B-59395 TaxID=644548 RepID=F1YK19_9ACTN|nr:ABC transporter substrate-binding protein [Gordonia neofelifaecis]EGD55101.1 spermidine/putrescine ABC transporter substrate-binding protein [Gordonia neofelifaecis NRRL B-59395]
MATISRLVSVAVIVAAMTISAACANDDVPPQSAPSSLGPSEKVLNVLAWPGYAEDGSTNRAVDWVRPFRQLTGCQVHVKTFGTSDEAVAQMRTGEFDVVSASGDASRRLIDAGDVQPINTTLISNYGAIYPFLKDQPWNAVDDTVYGVPHGWGANVLMYRTDVVRPAPTSWRAVFEDARRYAGRVTAYDSPIYIADAALYLMRHRPDLRITDPYALDTTQFAAAVALLTEQRTAVGEYWNDVVREVQAFGAGWSVIGSAWQVAANLASDGGAPVATVLPEEGSTGWSDSWMIAGRTPHRNCAYRWIDYVVGPRVNARIAEYFGESPANSESCALMRNREHCAVYHSDDPAYAARIWYWTTPMRQCLDGRTDVECVDYAEWSKAWLEIKG